ncbi:MAG: hypothetical protein GY796_00910 [Chloroflexi bacterium]|nr:hypothetical protein [Chloroflexota bacterium]
MKILSFLRADVHLTLNQNTLLRQNEPNYVTFVNVNGAWHSLWDFALMHNNTLKWSDAAGQDADKFALGYMQTLQILPDNTVTVRDRKEEIREPLPGVWEAKIDAHDFGLILVNHIPAVVGYKSSFGEFDWFDISPYLSVDQMNEVVVMV